MACKTWNFKTFSLKTFLFLSFLFLTTIAFAQQEEHAPAAGTEDHPAEHAEKEFNAGTLILEHIGDAHDWHIMDVGGHAISIPLPIILYSNTKGLQVFSSSRFEHRHAEYNGYRLDGQHIVSNDSAEKIYDISITKNVAALLISVVLICIIFISIARSYTKRPGKAPKGLQSFLEPLILFVRDEVAKPSIGPKYNKFLPFLLTLFFFIFFNNLLGLVPFFPGGANLTGNIAVTMVLALFTFVITVVNGSKDYWIHIVNTPGVPWWLKFPVPLMPIVELMGFISKPVVLTLRLFANITAGHIIVLAFISLIFIFGKMSVGLGYGVSVLSMVFALFMDLMELLVAFLQAYVFTLLSALYFGSAVEEHHHAEEHH